MSTAVIDSSYVLCAIGRGTEQAWASARAGIARIGETEMLDSNFEPIRMGLVPDDALSALTPELNAMPLPPRARRLLRLAAPALRATLTQLAEPFSLCLALPHLPGERWMQYVPEYLRQLVGSPHLDPAHCVLVPEGRAAGLLALERALELLQREPAIPVVVCGVDTHFDPTLLAALDREQRLLSAYTMDGFIPGEGAACVVLRSAAVLAPGTVAVAAAASTLDAGHRGGDAPARGEGLALALNVLRQRAGSLAQPVATTFAGLNGEHFESKLWGVARMRHAELFAPDMALEHPADKYGDVGAATGVILTALAARALASGARRGPALVWAASDHEPRACALLSHAPA